MYTLYIAGKNMIKKEQSYTERLLNSFILCFVLTCFVQGLTEIAGVNMLRLSSASAQIVFSSAHIISYNQRKKALTDPS